MKPLPEPPPGKKKPDPVPPARPLPLGGTSEPTPQEKLFIELLKRMAEDDPARVAEIIQRWLETSADEKNDQK